MNLEGGTVTLTPEGFVHTTPTSTGRYFAVDGEICYAVRKPAMSLLP